MTTKKHSVEVVRTDLELEEHLALHERGWTVQHFGWFFIFALVALAALGVFGNGLASKRTITESGTRVEYERFFRQEAIMPLRISLTGASVGPPVISLPNHYLTRFKIESIVPEPREARVQGGQVAYHFDGTAPLQVVFYLSPQSPGTVSGTVQVNNRSIPLTHFIYP